MGAFFGEYFFFHVNNSYVNKINEHKNTIRLLPLIVSHSLSIAARPGMLRHAVRPNHTNYN